MIAAWLDRDHVELDDKLNHLQQIASSSASTTEDPNELYRALAAFAASYLDHTWHSKKAKRYRHCGMDAAMKSSWAS